MIEINKYDLLGNVITHTECKGGVPYDWEYEYNNFGKIALSKEPYKSGGVLKQIQKKYQYNLLGMLVYVQNMMDTPTDTGYDVCDLYSYNLVSGNLLSSCHQNYNGTDAITTSATYDKNSNQLTSTDGNGVTVTYDYDEIDRKVSESVTIDTVEHKDVIDYDLNGNITRTVDWRGNSWYYSYDSMNRLYEKEDPYNTVYEKLEYDARNLQVSSYDANDKKTEYTYDKNKRLTSTLDPLSHTQSQTYDNLGNIKEKIDGRNNQIVYKYDIMGRVEEVYDSTVLKSKYTYYIDGALKEQKIGNATTNYVTTYTYNPFGMVESITDPAETGVPTTTETYEYYPTGTVKSKVDRNGKTTTYEYDCHDRMLKQTTGDSNNSITITIPNTTSDKGYDGNGNLKKVILEKKVSGTVVSTITTERTYDDLDRVATKKETSVEGGVTTVIGPVAYTYDLTSGVLDGEVKEQSSYPGSNTVTKVYDCAGRLKSVSDGQQTDYEYDANGRRESITYNDTFKQTYTYYDDGLLDELTNLVKNSSGVYVESEYYKYYYDAAHNMSGKDERISGTTKTTTYTYDSMNRLETVTEPTKTTEYTFDLKGNRETVTVTEGSDVTYTLYEYTNNNRLKYETKRNDGLTGTIIQKKQYAYDNNGNQTAITDITGTPSVITTNTYTLINQLENSTTAGNTMKNTYNAEGKRVSKALNTGSPTRYFYEGNKAVFEYANGGTVTAFNVIGSNLISRKIGTDKVYYSYNGHGDVTALLDAVTKNKRAQYAYDAFGNITDEKYYDSNGNITTNPANTIKSPIRYGEYQYDSETEYTDAQGNFVTGLYYLNARHYDPGTARFLEVDTYSGNIADPLSLNLYTYCRNEPIMYTDPTGHYTQGKVFSYVEGQPQNYDPDVWEIQEKLIYLGFMSKDDVPAGQEGYYGPNTVRAVNKFKNKYLSGGNKGDNEGKFGDTTWLYLKRQVALKNLEGIAKNDYFAVETAKIWNEFYSSYDKLIAKPKSSSSTSGNTFDYGKSASLNQGMGEPIITFTPGDITFLYHNELFKHISMEQSLAVLLKLKSTGGIITPNDLVSLGIAEFKDYSGMFKWVKETFDQSSPENLASLLETQYRLNQDGYSFAQIESMELKMKQDIMQALVGIMSMQVVLDSLPSKGSNPYFNPNSKFDMIEKDGYYYVSPVKGTPNTQTLFRGDRSSVSPDVAFKQGFTPKGTHNNLEQHVTSNTTAGNFVSTTSEKGIAQQFAGKNGYVYEIQTSNYVDVNKTLGAKSPFPEQMEFSIPGGVNPSQIKGAWVMKGGKLTGEFIPNPGFTGGK